MISSWNLSFDIFDFRNFFAFNNILFSVKFAFLRHNFVLFFKCKLSIYPTNFWKNLYLLAWFSAIFGLFVATISLFVVKYALEMKAMHFRLRTPFLRSDGSTCNCNPNIELCSPSGCLSGLIRVILLCSTWKRNHILLQITLYSS